MVGLGLGLAALAGPFRRHVPAACAVAMIVVGLLAVAGRMRPGEVHPPPLSNAGRRQEPPEPTCRHVSPLMSIAEVHPGPEVDGKTPARGALAACAHCALPVPAWLIKDGAARQFCCQGCRAVWNVIHEQRARALLRAPHGGGTGPRAGERAGLRRAGRSRLSGARVPPCARRPAHHRAVPRGRALQRLRVARRAAAPPCSPAWCETRLDLPRSQALVRGIPRPWPCPQSRGSSTRSATRRIRRAAPMPGRSGGGRTARCSCASVSRGPSRAMSWPSPSRSTAACSTGWSRSSPRSSAGRASASRCRR